jgi:hypothetical protein
MLFPEKRLNGDFVVGFAIAVDDDRQGLEKYNRSPGLPVLK